MLSKPWATYDDNWQEPTVNVWDNLCFVSGVARGEQGTIGVLAANCRPDGRLIFNLIKGNSQARVDVLPDGQVVVVAGGGSQWISLNGIWFQTNRPRGVNLVWGWVPYGYGYRPVTQSKNGELCMISGLIRSGNWGYFAQMAPDCIPRDGRLIFSCDNHGLIVRVDVLQGNGYLVRSGGYANHGWVSLDGIAFTQYGGNTLNLNGGWVNYANGYRGASWTKTGPICVVSGLIRSSSWPASVATLPAECRPKKPMIFGGNVHMKSAVIEVHPSGEVRVRPDTKAQWDWLSLDGVKFYV